MTIHLEKLGWSSSIYQPKRRSYPSVSTVHLEKLRWSHFFLFVFVFVFIYVRVFLNSKECPDFMPVCHDLFVLIWWVKFSFWIKLKGQKYGGHQYWPIVMNLPWLKMPLKKSGYRLNCLIATFLSAIQSCFKNVDIRPFFCSVGKFGKGFNLFEKNLFCSSN